MSLINLAITFLINQLVDPKELPKKLKNDWCLFKKPLNAFFVIKD